MSHQRTGGDKESSRGSNSGCFHIGGGPAEDAQLGLFWGLARNKKRLNLRKRKNKGGNNLLE